MTLSTRSFVVPLCFLVILSLLGSASVGVIAQSAPVATNQPPAAKIQPLLANLTFPMDMSRLKVGSKFQARVTQPWSYGTCQLQPTNLVEGHVSQVEKRIKASSRSAFHLVFDSAECDRRRGTPIKLTLIALIGPFGTAPPNGQSGVSQTQPLTALPLSIGGGPRSAETASSLNGYAIGRSLPSRWKIGMVVDVPMKLSVGAGVDGGSVIWATDREARLEGQTTFILFPTPEPPPTPAAKAASPAPATP